MKKYSLVIMFFGLLAFLAIGTLFHLDADFSPAERRMLSRFPEPDGLSLRNWTWDEEMESFLADHLFMRDALTGICSYLRLGTGTQRLNDVYMTGRGELVESPVLCDEGNKASLRKNLKHLDQLAEKEGISITMLVPPSAGFARKDSLPVYLRQLYRDDILLSEISGYSNLKPVDLLQELGQGRGDLFYRTDNHWNANGAYVAYAALITSGGGAPREAGEIRYESFSDFHGSTLSRSAFWLTPHETIQFPILDYPYKVCIENEPARCDLYFREALTSYDPYAVFFNGNYGIVRLTNPAADGGSLLIIKDSFANSVAPLLLSHYRTIVMIDPRFYRGTIHELIETEKIEQICCICSLKTIVTEGKIMLLR